MPLVRKGKLVFAIEDTLPLNYGHKLRGFFSRKFDELLFHNHHGEGQFRYGYPLIQYKIINGKPTVISLGDGVDLIAENFLELEKLNLGDKEYVKPEIQFKIKEEELKVESKDFDMLPFKYTFITPWMGLNQRNFRKYEEEIINSDKKEEIKFIRSILIGNILSFAKGVDWWVEKDIKLYPDLERITIMFKNQEMVGFKGIFYSNILLPDKVGLGQSTSRGFGTIKGEKTY